MIGVTNTYIDKTLQEIGSKSFIGTYSSDTVPYLKDHNIAMVVNLSKENESGSHFVVILILKEQVMYFDSFGGKCFVSEINNYLLSFGKEILYSDTPIQDLQSVLCGIYCIAFIVAYDSKINVHDFLDIFSNQNLLYNDVVVGEFLSTMIRN